MVESDWAEALQLLEAGGGDEQRRRSLATVVRDEVERLQRAEGSFAARVRELGRGKPAPRARAVTLVCDFEARRFSIGVAPFDVDWIAQLFTDSLHVPVDLRFRPTTARLLDVVPYEPGDEQDGDLIMVEVRGDRLAPDGAGGVFRYMQCLTPGAPAGTGAAVEPEPVVDVSSTVLVAPTFAPPVNPETVCERCGKVYFVHPLDTPGVHRLCDGRLVKL